MHIEIKTLYPFTDTEGRQTDQGYRVELVKETARSKAGHTPFQVSLYSQGECWKAEAFTGIDEALEFANQMSRQMSSLRKDHALWGDRQQAA